MLQAEARLLKGAGCASAQTEGEKPVSQNQQNSIGALSLLPSATNAAATFLVRGRQGLRPFVPRLHLMGELSAQPTEGEKPVSQNQQNSIGALSLLPTATNAAATFLVRGRQGERPFVPRLHLMGELAVRQHRLRERSPFRRTGCNSKCTLSLLSPTTSAPSSSEEGKVTDDPAAINPHKF